MLRFWEAYQSAGGAVSASASIAATSGVTAARVVDHPRTANVAGISGATIGRIVDHPRAVFLAASSGVTVTPRVGFVRSVQVVANSACAAAHGARPATARAEFVWAEVGMPVTWRRTQLVAEWRSA